MYMVSIGHWIASIRYYIRLESMVGPITSTSSADIDRSAYLVMVTFLSINVIIFLFIHGDITEAYFVDDHE